MCVFTSVPAEIPRQCKSWTLCSIIPFCSRKGVHPKKDVIRGIDNAMPANETLDDLVRRMTMVRIVVEQQNFHDSVLRSCDSGTAKKIMRNSLPAEVDLDPF